jgi:hypothetical protein
LSVSCSWTNAACINPRIENRTPRSSRRRFGGIAEIRGGPIVLRAAAFAIAEQQGAIRRAEQTHELLLDGHSACVLDGSGVGSLGISEGFVDVHVNLRVGVSGKPENRWPAQKSRLDVTRYFPGSSSLMERVETQPRRVLKENFEQKSNTSATPGSLTLYYKVKAFTGPEALES